MKFNFIKESESNVAIEFAIVVPVVFLLLFGVINFGLILGNQNQFNAVASAGMLYAFGKSSSPTAVQTAMTNSAPNLTPLTVTATQFCQCLNGANIVCTKTCAGGVVPGTYVTVTAQSQVNLIALNFILQDPFVTTIQGTIRTN